MEDGYIIFESNWLLPLLSNVYIFFVDFLSEKLEPAGWYNSIILEFAEVTNRVAC